MRITRDYKNAKKQTLNRIKIKGYAPKDIVKFDGIIRPMTIGSQDDLLKRGGKYGDLDYWMNPCLGIKVLLI